MANPNPLSVTPRNILLIKLRHHGDMLLTTPVINALRQRYPEASIDVLLYKETRPMLEAHPAIRQLHVIDRQWKREGSWRKLSHERALLSAVRRCRYDVVINLADQWSSGLIALLSGAPVRIGFAFKKRDNALWRRCHTQLVSTENHRHLHTVEQNMSILQPLGIPADGARASMHFSEADARQVETLLDAQEVRQPFIVFQPTSRWQFKCWEEESVAATLDRLSQDGHQVVLTAGPDKQELAMITRIQALCRTSAPVSLAGQLTLPQLAALIARAQLFIGVDSAPMHIAAALNTPCLALFGPTKLQFWRPWGDNNRVIWAGDYAPLPDPDAIDTGTGHRYLTAIPVEDVVQAARSFLHD